MGRRGVFTKKALTGLGVPHHGCPKAVAILAPAKTSHLFNTYCLESTANEAAETASWLKMPVTSRIS